MLLRECQVLPVLLPAVALQPLFQDLANELADQRGILRGSSRQKWIVQDRGHFFTYSAVVLAMWSGGVPQDVFQWVEGRAKVGTSVHWLTVIAIHLCEAGSFFVVILSSMSCDIFASDDTFTICPVSRKCKAGYAVTFCGNEFIAINITENQIVEALIVDHVDHWSASTRQ